MFIEDAFYSAFYARLLLNAGDSSRYSLKAVDAMLQAPALMALHHRG